MSNGWWVGKIGRRVVTGCGAKSIMFKCDSVEGAVLAVTKMLEGGAVLNQAKAINGAWISLEADMMMVLFPLVLSLR